MKIFKKATLVFCCTSAEPPFRPSIEGADKQQRSGCDNVVCGCKFDHDNGVT